jgi:micrococcal nuclease
MARRALWLIVILMAGSSYCSHRKAPVDALSLDGQRVRVTRVIDGDTIDVRSPSSDDIIRVRLRGIDAPEIHPPAHWGTQATQYLKQRIEMHDVVLKCDPPQTHDRYGRLLAFVYVNAGECINLSLVRDGHAYADRRFNSFMRSQIEQAETSARTKKTGLWADVTLPDQPAWRQAWLSNRDIKN